MTEKATTPARVRWMIRCDMQAVLGIENKSFPEPWTEDDFIECLRQRNYIGMVAVDDSEDGKVLGFIIYELARRKFVIHNLAVHPAFRRRGVGSVLIERLKNKVGQTIRCHIRIDVPDDLTGVHLFLKKMGFRGKCADESTYSFSYGVEEYEKVWKK